MKSTTVYGSWCFFVRASTARPYIDPALRQLAEKENRKLSNMVETILKKYVEEHQDDK